MADAKPVGLRKFVFYTLQVILVFIQGMTNHLDANAVQAHIVIALMLGGGNVAEHYFKRPK